MFFQINAFVIKLVFELFWSLYLTFLTGPREKEAWVKRLKEEYMSLISYVQSNKESDSDW